MLKLHENGSRLAGQVAAIDAIEEFADEMEARHMASLRRRADMIQRTRRNAKAR